MLYRRRGSTWAFTEARPGDVERTPQHFAVSGSRIERSADALVIHLDERTAPWGRRLKGRVRVELEHGAPVPVALDQAGEHHWWPLGAKARAEVELDEPSASFRGSAYHDCNFGDVPLEDTFASWNWSRAEVGEDVCIVYDVREAEAPVRPLGVRITPGGVEPLLADVHTELPKGLWGMDRAARSHGPASLVRTLEDTPFYTRSLLQTAYDGQSCLLVHESLRLDRFVRPWVQFLLPFRIRRGRRA